MDGAEPSRRHRGTHLEKTPANSGLQYQEAPGRPDAASALTVGVPPHRVGPGSILTGLQTCTPCYQDVGQGSAGIRGTDTTLSPLGTMV